MSIQEQIRDLIDMYEHKVDLAKQDLKDSPPLIGPSEVVFSTKVAVYETVIQDLKGVLSSMAEA